jgi:hypothetical protein
MPHVPRGGAGQGVTGLLRRIDGALTGIAVEDVAGLDKALTALEA